MWPTTVDPEQPCATKRRGTCFDSRLAAACSLFATGPRRITGRGCDAEYLGAAEVAVLVLVFDVVDSAGAAVVVVLVEVVLPTSATADACFWLSLRPPLRSCLAPPP